MLHGDPDQVGQFFIFFTLAAETKLNIHGIFIWHHECYVDFLCTFSLGHLSTGPIDNSFLIASLKSVLFVSKLGNRFSQIDALLNSMLKVAYLYFLLLFCFWFWFLIFCFLFVCVFIFHLLFVIDIIYIILYIYIYIYIYIFCFSIC